MADVLEYKCPSCGGAIRFDPVLQKLKCPFCETEFEVETLKQYDDILKNEPKDNLHFDPYGKDSGSGDWNTEESAHLRIYHCTSCGANILGDETLAATACPYCENPVVMTEQFAGTLRPDYVIPFYLKPDAAKEALKQSLKGKWLLPKLFKTENRIDSLKGVYVPVWLYDCDADAHLRFNATRRMTWSDANFIHTKTDHFLVVREGSIGFCRVPADGSKKMDDTLMQSLEPFDYTQIVDFQTAYLAGFLADRYDEDANECSPRAGERIKNSTTAAFASTVVGYHSVTPNSVSVNLKHGETRYALFPVYLLSTVYKGETYRFAMNGQTGKFVGDLPVDRGRYWGFFFGFSALVSALAVALIQFLL